MSAESVQQAVAAYVTAANIPLLVKVFPDPPFDMEDVPWNDLTPAGSTSAAVGIVFVDSDEDEVIAFDGAGGRRKCTYAVSLEVMLWDVGADAAAFGANYDAIITAIKFRLRADPTLGTTPTGNNDIIQAAVSRLQVERGRPVRLGNGDAPARWAGIQFAVETYEFST